MKSPKRRKIDFTRKGDLGGKDLEIWGLGDLETGGWGDWERRISNVE